MDLQIIVYVKRVSNGSHEFYSCIWYPCSNKIQLLFNFFNPLHSTFWLCFLYVFFTVSCWYQATICDIMDSSVSADGRVGRMDWVSILWQNCR